MMSFGFKTSVFCRSAQGVYHIVCKIQGMGETEESYGCGRKDGETHRERHQVQVCNRVGEGHTGAEGAAPYREKVGEGGAGPFAARRVDAVGAQRAREEGGWCPQLLLKMLISFNT